MLEYVNKEKFENKISSSNNLIIADFFETWCGPCQMLTPILEQISNEVQNIDILKIDIDKEGELAINKEINVVPTILFIKNGKEIDRIEGVLPKDVLLKEIDKYNN